VGAGAEYVHAAGGAICGACETAACAAHRGVLAAVAVAAAQAPVELKAMQPGLQPGRY